MKAGTAAGVFGGRNKKPTRAIQRSSSSVRKPEHPVCAAPTNRRARCEYLATYLPNIDHSPFHQSSPIALVPMYLLQTTYLLTPSPPSPTCARSDSGISPLFDCMIDEAIVYPPELRSELPRREERPDRVYGLRATKRLERILTRVDKRPAASGQCIGDSVRSHPFRDDAEPVHFPFLLLEAKSEKGPESLSDAANQTAFSIRELLLLQQDLQLAAGEGGPDNCAEPLVWFLSYKGEEWKVCIAYIDKKTDVSRFVSIRVTLRFFYFFFYIYI